MRRTPHSSAHGRPLPKRPLCRPITDDLCSPTHWILRTASSLSITWQSDVKQSQVQDTAPSISVSDFRITDHLFRILQVLCSVLICWLTNRGQKIPAGWCKQPRVTTARQDGVHLLVIPQSVLRQVYRLSRSDFSTDCEPVLPLSISSILSFP